MKSFQNWKNFICVNKSHVTFFIIFSAEVDLTQIDPKKDINETKSLLEVLLILMIKNFNLSTKEAVALLSN